MLGYASPEELGESVTDIGEQLHLDRERRREFTEEIARHGAVPEFEARLYRKDGSLLWAATSARAVRDERGEILYFEGTTHDISERKRAEAERERLESELRQAQKMEAIGRLAGGVAHDFNNLLTAIGGYVELLLAELPEDDPRRADAEEIEKAARRASSLTRQLLAFSRRHPLERESIDLNEVVHDMERLLRRLIGADVELVTVLAARLGLVEADRGQLEQVIVNLAVNARDAMPNGGRLIIETADAGDHVSLSIRDTGVGMDAETTARVFEPFFTTKAVGEGTGLGLSTVFGIVEQSSGRIFVDSAPGAGTTFTIELPRRDAAPQPVRTQPRPQARPLSGHETVLLVEDDDVIRGLAARALRDHGYEVLEVPDASQALERWSGSERPVDVLLSDIVMPGMSGIELAQRVRDERPQTAVMLMSGLADAEVAAPLSPPSGALFLEKPFTATQLVQAVRRALESRA
jgi:two-component system, cell cycle sensor histidine kinase and response regulator CckA